MLRALRIELRVDQVVMFLGDSFQIFMIMCSDLHCRFFLRRCMADIAQIRCSHSGRRELRGIFGANLLIPQLRYPLVVCLFLSFAHARELRVARFCNPVQLLAQFGIVNSGDPLGSYRRGIWWSDGLPRRRPYSRIIGVKRNRAGRKTSEDIETLMEIVHTDCCDLGRRLVLVTYWVTEPGG